MEFLKNKIKSGFCRSLEDRSGTVMILFALALLPVLLSVGSAIDFGRSYHTRSVLQGSADAGVLAAALSGTEGDAMIQVAIDSFEANLETRLSARLLGPPIAEVDFQDGIITMRVGARVKTTLLGVLRESVDVGVLSRARLLEGGPACIVSLDPTAPEALKLSGTAQVNATDCGIQVNSDHPESITQNGSADADVPHICTRGGFTGSLTTRPRRCPPLEDPLMQAVTDAIASEMPRSGTRSPTVKKNHGLVTLQPGLYRGTLRVQANAFLQFEPGVYFIEDGDFEVWANSAVRGDNVTIVFVGSQAGGVEIRSGSDVVLSASTSGPFEGLLFVQDPNATPKDDESILIGGGNLELTGTIYLPLHELTITGNGDISANSPQFAIIAKTISLEGNGQLNINMDTDYEAAGYDELPGVVSYPGVTLIE